MLFRSLERDRERVIKGERRESDKGREREREERVIKGKRRERVFVARSLTDRLVLRYALIPFILEPIPWPSTLRQLGTAGLPPYFPLTEVPQVQTDLQTDNA